MVNVYKLDLSNEFASINFDEHGLRPLPGAVIPQCTAELTLNGLECLGAKYYISTPDYQHASGISINENTGVLIFTNTDQTPLS